MTSPEGEAIGDHYFETHPVVVVPSDGPQTSTAPRFRLSVTGGGRDTLGSGGIVLAAQSPELAHGYGLAITPSPFVPKPLVVSDFCQIFDVGFEQLSAWGVGGARHPLMVG